MFCSAVLSSTEHITSRQMLVERINLEFLLLATINRSQIYLLALKELKPFL